MRQTRRIPALLLAVAMLFSLAGCKKEAPIPGDEVAVALFEMILKDDASKVVELFGYADEAEARQDMGLGEDSIYDALADEILNQFKAMGVNASTENTADFDVDFELAEMDVGGTTKRVWVPKDTEKFGEQISTTAMGG